jgi:hypothetical protein
MKEWVITPHNTISHNQLDVEDKAADISHRGVQLRENTAVELTRLYEEAEKG